MSAATNEPLMQPKHIGRVIVGGAVLLVVGLVVLVLIRGQALRPDLSAVPLPEGAVVHGAVEDCQGDGPTVCTASLAVGPAGGIELPRETERMLLEHLRSQGWSGSGSELASPEDRMRVTISDYDPEAAPGQLDDRVDEDIVREDLALVTVAPQR